MKYFKCFIFLNIFLIIEFENHALCQTTTTSNDSILAKWKYDSTGCLRKRTIHDGKYLVDKYGLFGKSRSELEAIIGRPNLEIIKPNRILITYFIGGSCNLEGRLIKNHDFCYCQFVIVEGKIADVVYNCT